MPKIIPTVGRIVWFRPATSDAESERTQLSDQPYAATVAHVNDDGTVNLTVHGHDGRTFARTNVPLWDGEGARPEFDKTFAEWMPYQLGQAARNRPGKTDAMRYPNN
jgi:hypothetical protein